MTPSRSDSSGNREENGRGADDAGSTGSVGGSRQQGPYGPLWAELPACGFEDEGSAPNVDDERLRLLERNQLTEEQRFEVLRLIQTYESWWCASVRITREEYRRRLQSGGTGA